MSWGWLMQFIQSVEFTTQSAHMGWGGFVTLALSLWMPWRYAAALFVLGWVLPKEFIFDALPGGEGHGAPDWLDAAFYLIGVLLACCILIFRGSKCSGKSSVLPS